MLEEVKKILNDFYEKNDILTLLTEDEKIRYRDTMDEYFEKMIGKTWKNLRTELLENKMSWDNYGVAVMLLLNLYDLQITEIKEDNGDAYTLLQYINLLKEIILSEPSKRASCEETRLLLNGIRVPKKKYEELKRSIVQQASIPGSYERVKQGILESDRLPEKARIYKK